MKKLLFVCILALGFVFNVNAKSNEAREVLFNEITVTVTVPKMSNEDRIFLSIVRIDNNGALVEDTWFTNLNEDGEPTQYGVTGYYYYVSVNRIGENTYQFKIPVGTYLLGVNDGDRWRADGPIHGDLTGLSSITITPAQHYINLTLYPSF